jgi:hypothetical protein
MLRLPPGGREVRDGLDGLNEHATQQEGAFGGTRRHPPFGMIDFLDRATGRW